MLSIAANIVSKQTSMVGVDLKNEDKVVGDLVQRQVPLMMSAKSAYVSIFRKITNTASLFDYTNQKYLAKKINP